MADRAHPYADTRAARMLAEGLKRYTAERPGGLRALATGLEIKQATVLSHMANGRIGIPLDRATEFATKLGMDVTGFCLAVLEQRAPSVYEVVDGELQLHEAQKLPGDLREMLNRAAARNALTDEHVQIINQVLATKRPSEKWMRPLEDEIIKAIRERFPDGISLLELGDLLDWIEALPDD